MLSAVPLIVSGAAGAFFVVAANAWMNNPTGFRLDDDGGVVDGQPWAAMSGPSTWPQVVHMLLAAYMVTGFTVASVYAVGTLRGRRDRHHRWACPSRSPSPPPSPRCRSASAARAASALAVTAILAGWVVAQYPHVLVPDVTIEEAAGGRATLTAVLVALVAGAVVLLPALAYLHRLFQQSDPEASAGRPAGTPAGDTTSS